MRRIFTKKRETTKRLVALLIAFVMVVGYLPISSVITNATEPAEESVSIPQKPIGNKDYADFMQVHSSGDTKFENGKAYSTSTSAEPRVRFDMTANGAAAPLPFTKDDTYVFGFDVVTTEAQKGWHSARAILGAVNNQQLELQFRGDCITLFQGDAQKWSEPFTRELGTTYRIDILVEPTVVSVWVDGSLVVDNQLLPDRTEMRTGVKFSYVKATVSSIDLYYTAAEDVSGNPQLPVMPDGNKDYADYMAISTSSNYTFGDGILSAVSADRATSTTYGSLPFGVNDTYVYGFNLTTKVADANYKSARVTLGTVQDGSSTKTLRMFFLGDSIGLYKDGDCIWGTRFNRALGETYRVDILVEPSSVSLWVNNAFVKTVNNLPTKTAATTGVQFENTVASLSDIDLYYTTAEDFSSNPQLPIMPEGNKDYADYMTIGSSDYYTFKNGTLASNSAERAASVTFGNLPFAKEDTYVYGFNLTTDEADANYKSARVILGKVQDGSSTKTLRMFFLGNNIGLYKDNDCIWETRFNRALGETYRVDILVEPNTISLWINRVYVATINNLPDKTETTTGVLFENAKVTMSDFDLYYTTIVNAEYENYFDSVTSDQVIINSNGAKPNVFTAEEDVNGNVTFSFDTVNNTTNAGDSDVIYYDFNSNCPARWDGLGWYADKLRPQGLDVADTFVYQTDFNISADSVKSVYITFRTPKYAEGSGNSMVNQSGVQFTTDGIYLKLLGASMASPYKDNSYRDGSTHTLKVQSSPDKVSVWVDNTLIFNNVDYDFDAVVAANDSNGKMTKNDGGGYTYRDSYIYSNSTMYPAFGFYVNTVDLTISNPVLYNYDYVQAKNHKVMLKNAYDVDYTYDYTIDGQFAMPFNSQIFPDNVSYQEDYDRINMCATMTYPEGTTTHSMLSGFYLGSAKRCIDGEATDGTAHIYIGYLPTVGEILLWDGNYNFAILSGGKTTDILPEDADMDGVSITYQMNYTKSTDTLTFKASSNGESIQCKFSNITTIIANGRVNYAYNDFQFDFGLGHDKQNGEDPIMVSDVRVWGDVDVKDILVVGDGELSYPITLCVEEQDVLPTDEYLEQTISLGGELLTVRHYLMGWKDEEGNSVSTYQSGKTYTPEYIDTKMLEVHVQYKEDSENSTSADEKVITRFIGSVDKLEDYTEAGFILSTKERQLELGKGYKEISGITTVYAGLYENVNDATTYKRAEDIYDEYSNYMFAYDIGNLPAGKKVYARAYVKLSDGTIVLGNVRKVLTGENHLEVLRDKISGKTLSVLGDSISTYVGYSNDAVNTNSTIGDNAICYDGNYILTDVHDTWWMQAVNDIGMNLLVNNSYSGDKVCLKGQNRSLQLHDDTGENAGTNPDIIAVYLGTNDFNGNCSVETFKTNYSNMISNMVQNYEDADVFLFTLNARSGMERTVAEMEAFNTVIEETAKTYNCTLVDLYYDSGMNFTNTNKYTGDGLHPNAEGMDLITDVFIDALIEKYR